MRIEQASRSLQLVYWYVPRRGSTKRNHVSSNGVVKGEMREERMSTAAYLLKLREVVVSSWHRKHRAIVIASPARRVASGFGKLLVLSSLRRCSPRTVHCLVLQRLRVERIVRVVVDRRLDRATR